MLTLFPPQARCVDSLLRSLWKHRAALNSSITGSGKTIQSVELARRFGRPVFVVAPKITLPAWKDAFSEQGVPLLEALNYEALRNGNREWVKKAGRKNLEWNLPKDSLVIFDECHKALNRSTLNGKMVLAASTGGHSVLLLSATAGSDPSEFGVIGEVLGLHEGKNFVRWAQRNGCTLDPWRNLTFPKKNRAKLDELNSVIYPELGYKLTRDDMGDYFRRTSIITEPMDFGDIQAVYDEMQAEVDSITAKEGEYAEVMVAELRARQKAEVMKVPMLVDLVQEELDNHRSVVVFFAFRDSMQAFVDRAPVECGQIHGDIKQDERQSVLKRFEKDELRLVACQICAGGVGISLHDRNGDFPRTAFVCASYEEKVIVQALGRVDRAGQKSDSIQRILFAKGTIEEKVERSMRRKLDNLFQLHDFQGGEEKISPEAIFPLAQETDPAILTTTMSEGSPPKVEEPAAHHRFGPSGLKNWLVCPGFTNRTDLPEHERTTAGTRIHEAVELDDPSKLINDEETDMFYQLCDIREKLTGPGSPGEREVRIHIDLGDEQPFGTADHLYINGDKAVLLDWKTGRHRVPAADKNPQGIAYAVGVFQKYDAVQSVTVAFIQPYCDYVTMHTFGRHEVAWMVPFLTDLIAKRKQALENRNDPAMHCVNAMCQFCARAANGDCPALREKATEVARSYVEDDVKVPDCTHGSLTDDPETIAANFRLAKMLEPFIEGAKLRAQRLYWEEGIDLPGYTPVERKGRKTVKPNEAWATFQEILPGAPIEDFIALTKDVSFTALADLAKERAPKGKKTKVVSELELRLREMGAINETSPTRFFAAAKEE